ncbi:MAG: M50 family metallopeptidase [Bacteroidota bacterium]
MKTGKFIGFILLLGSLGAGIGFTLAKTQVVQGLFPSKEDLSAWYFLYFLLSIFLAILIHELGHLLSGLYQGFSFEFFVIGFLGLKRTENRKIKLFFNKNLNTFGGVAATSPKYLDSNTLKMFANVILAGPIASLLFGILTAILVFFTSQPFSFILLCTSLMCFMIFLAVTLPSRTGIFYTDRKRYQRLRSDGLEKDIEWAFFKAYLLQLKQEPITQMDPEELTLLTRDSAPLFQYIGYYYLIDFYKGNSEKIESLREEMAPIEKDLPKSMVVNFHKEIEKLLGR